MGHPDSLALCPVILQLDTWDFVPSSGTKPQCLSQNLMHLAAIIGLGAGQYL